MLHTVLLSATSAGQSMVPQLVLMSGIMLVFYFFMVRPEQLKQQAQRTFLEKMKKGTEVVTVGGIYGKVYEVSGDRVTLEVDHKGSKITVWKGAISLESTQRYAAAKKSDSFS